MANIYQQVNSNKLRSTLVLVFFTAFILGAAYLLSLAFDLGVDFMIMAFIFSILSSGVSFFYGDKIILGLNGAVRANRKEYFNLYTVTENLSLVSRIPMPQLYVIKDEAMNAFATGRDPEHAVICVTQGLLNQLNRTQLEGVIAHEMSHVRNFDIRLMMIVSVLLGSLTLLINFTSRSMMWGRGRRDDEDRGGSPILMVVGLVLIIFAPLIGQLIQLAISRRREYLADASAVMLTRQPNGLIEALKIISQDPKLHTANTATAPLYIENPFQGQKIANLFSTHPPVEDRIKALEQML